MQLQWIRRVSLVHRVVIGFSVMALMMLVVGGGAAWALAQGAASSRGSWLIGVGTVAAENLANFEHAVTQGDPRNRVHFQLDAAQAAATSRLRVTIDLRGGGAWIGQSIPGFSTHDITVTLNGQPVGVRNNITWDTILDFTVAASAARSAKRSRRSRQR